MKIALLRITALLLATTFAACSSTPPDRRALSLEVASSLDDINAGHRRQLDAATLASIETLERDAAEARLDARATLVDRFDRAAAAPRPVVALIDLWWNAAMLRDSAREGQLREVFGSDADQLQRTAEGTYDKIEELASRYLTQAQLAEMRDKIDLHATALNCMTAQRRTRRSSTRRWRPRSPPRPPNPVVPIRATSSPTSSVCRCRPSPPPAAWRPAWRRWWCRLRSSIGSSAAFRNRVGVRRSACSTTSTCRRSPARPSRT